MRRSYLQTLGTAILLFTISAAEKTNGMQYQERSSDEASTLSTQAAAALDSHHYSEAVDLLERVVALRPDDAQTRYRLGRVLHNQERFIESIAAFRQALRLNPNFADAYHALGVAYNDSKHFGDAIDAFKHALQLLPGRAETLSELAYSYSMSGQSQEAIDYCMEALRIRPDLNAVTYNTLGVAYFNLEKREQALEAFEHAIKLEPNNAAFYNNLGYTYAEIGRAH